MNLDTPLPVRVRKLVQISNLHPAQWQGRTESGAYIFVRYRYGRLWLGIAPDYHRTPPTTVFETGYGDLVTGISRSVRSEDARAPWWSGPSEQDAPA